MTPRKFSIKKGVNELGTMGKICKDIGKMAIGDGKEELATKARGGRQTTSSRLANADAKDEACASPSLPFLRKGSKGPPRCHTLVLGAGGPLAAGKRPRPRPRPALSAAAAVPLERDLQARGRGSGGLITFSTDFQPTGFN